MHLSNIRLKSLKGQTMDEVCKRVMKMAECHGYNFVSKMQGDVRSKMVCYRQDCDAQVTVAKYGQDNFAVADVIIEHNHRQGKRMKKLLCSKEIHPFVVDFYDPAKGPFSGYSALEFARSGEQDIQGTKMKEDMARYYKRHEEEFKSRYDWSILEESVMELLKDVDDNQEGWYTNGMGVIACEVLRRPVAWFKEDGQGSTFFPVFETAEKFALPLIMYN
ncbi:hypothetical protein BCR43DRAFT_504142 [Syncephalastrum racemosum]|uniref:Uncharacterized protein n=1 Tax=Syncephalastrum racemosum TaxID=13706 RepID=A0A1X2HDX7_SYNRA|nr:hypothetical protein BCR43DRAFT_504142 [Syncephalastrum racemosum]